MLMLVINVAIFIFYSSLSFYFININKKNTSEKGVMCTLFNCLIV